MKVKEFLKPTKWKIGISISISIIIIFFYILVIVPLCTKSMACLDEGGDVVSPYGYIPFVYCGVACTQEAYYNTWFQYVIPYILLPIVIVSYLLSCIIIQFRK